VITVGPIIPRHGCSSAEPASASPDNQIYVVKQYKIRKEKSFYQKLNRLFVESSFGRFLEIRCGSYVSFAWGTLVSLGVIMIWSRDIFKTTGKNHPCRHNDVGRLMKNHEPSSRRDGWGRKRPNAKSNRAVATGRSSLE
jgi:hypothetical protein